jgi:hypothetical protein
MADFSYDDAYGVDEAAQGASVATIINWAGAIVSLTLLGGLAWWGWQLLVRDVSGVPVITALEGPMRVAPEDPGGIVAEHQGLAVNRIPAVGEAAPGAEMVVLAPMPSELTEEDGAMATLLPDAAPEEAANSASADAAASAFADPDLSPTDLAVLAALAELEPDLVAEPAVARSGEAQIVQASAVVGGIAVSPRPVPRPVMRAAAPAQPAASSAVSQAGALPDAAAIDAALAVEGAVTPVSTASSGLDFDPAAVVPGTRLVQLGAFPSQADAVAEWARIETAFGDYLGDKRRVIQQAETGGTTFYRLRAMGFTDLSDARRFCAVLVAGEASCIPVVAR